MRKLFLAALAALLLACPAYAIPFEFPAGPGVYRSVAKTVTTAATRLDSSAAQRQFVYVRNNGTAVLYVGFDNTVTTSTGWPVNPGETLPMKIGPSVTVFGIVASGSLDARVLEVF